LLHHASTIKGNYSNFTAIWDRLFGTYISPNDAGPVRYAALVYPAILVGVLRIGERLVFASELKSAFGIGMNRTIETIILVGALNLGLFLLKPRNVYISPR
jgi:hypothetical protein